MTATNNTKLQVNYKLADGTLVNIYADDVKELERGLTDIGMVSALIKSTGKELGGAPAQDAVSVVANAFPNAQVVTQAAPSAGGTHTCKHGEMTFRQSKPGAPKSWKGYFCPTPQGTPDQCEPKFIR